MKKNKKYWLEDWECELIRFHAKQRQINKERSGIDGLGTVNEKSGLELNSAGFGAEYVFCREMNLMPDFSVNNDSKKEGTDKYDANWNGWSVDVKCSRNMKNPMMIPKYSKCDVDIFAFFQGDLPCYEFKGFATNGMVFNEKNLKHTRVLSYVLDPYDMLTMDEIIFLKTKI
jgi:hypothetical protein